MTPDQFAAKWSKVSLSERSSYQQHFLDLCELVDHPKPAEADPTGDWFCFERGAEKHGGGDGWADVWKRGHFAFEYKGRHANLAKAYDQLLRYRASLENPPLLVVCDTDVVEIHTNFTGTAEVVHRFATADIGEPRNLGLLRALFHAPDKLHPVRTAEAITAEAASSLAALAGRLRARHQDPEAAARFLDRIVFCLFAEDVGLLPGGLFSELLANTKDHPERFARYTAELFAAMATGGEFQYKTIDHFNGGLFADPVVLDLSADEIAAIHAASQLDWGAVDPSIFGTLFQRGLDPSTRAALGAEYTSRRDIEDLIEPVLLAPLRREWNEVRTTLDNLVRTGQKRPKPGAKQPAGPALKKALGEAARLKDAFLQRLSRIHVLDPACGSGNFLYVALQKLKDLEKEVILHGGKDGLSTDFFPVIGPWQFHGLEINPYAFELAQLTLWIGYLQWHRGNGYPLTDKPILKTLDNFRLMDALLDLSDPDEPKEAVWPAVRSDQELIIVGNPPFLGDKIMRRELGDAYVDSLRSVFAGRIPGQSDLCCYWFEKARALIADGKVSRAGLLATQGIRGGANREVLKRIKDSGDIFFAVSDRDWILDGANVHISMVGFCGKEKRPEGTVLDGCEVGEVNANLTTGSNSGRLQLQTQNAGVGWIGVSMHGPFDFNEQAAVVLLNTGGNPTGKLNSDVVRPILNALEITRRAESRWVVAFTPETSQTEAALYEAPFEFVAKTVRPVREQNRRATYRDRWWLHGEGRPAMLEQLRPLPRFIATPRVSKHRVFVWVGPHVIPSDATTVFARSDDFFFGVLHSRIHEVWSLAQGTQLREKESGFRYTPTTCFETFPFPWDHRLPLEKLTDEQRAYHAAISEAALNLDELRARWLNPPEWTREEILEFPATEGGPWTRFIQPGTTNARYPRLIPRDAECAKQLSTRTLTKLYNTRPTWLTDAHTQLDQAVAAAYGCSPSRESAAILAHLLSMSD
ncbi:MAG: class I SAM-dependent DNA methyltransferase [Chthoniobacterales bacterium]|nr:class I SAM-dependent DNA methyltransferase [Chthoniobacterales bacterium]